jgi:hypothetical protein
LILKLLEYTSKTTLALKATRRVSFSSIISRRKENKGNLSMAKRMDTENYSLSEKRTKKVMKNHSKQL